MRKIIERTVTVALATGVVLAAYGLGSASTKAAYTEPPSIDQVHVSITYDEHGEARHVGLTDSEGLDLPVGSVAETWDDDNTDEEN